MVHTDHGAVSTRHGLAVIVFTGGHHVGGHTPATIGRGTTTLLSNNSRYTRQNKWKYKAKQDKSEIRFVGEEDNLSEYAWNINSVPTRFRTVTDVILIEET